MKSSRGFLTIQMLMITVLCFAVFQTYAEEKPITSSLGNPKIKLIGEMTLPSAINKIVFAKGKDGKTRISNILTKEGYYAVDEKSALTCLLDLNQRKTEDTRWVFEDAISNDGVWALASALPDPLPESCFTPHSIIVNLKTKEKTKIPVHGWPVFSESTIALVNSMGRTSTCFVDYEGNLLKTNISDCAFAKGSGHKSGFIGIGSSLCFFDRQGNVLKEIEKRLIYAFRVNYDTGQIAMYYCVYDESGKPKESRVGVYNWKGELQSEMTLPFDPNVDLGFSPDGRYVVVAARTGWVTALDMQNRIRLWKHNMEVGKVFYWHDPFPITNEAKLFAFVTMEPVSGKYLITIFTIKGEIIGYIERDRRPETRGFRLQFIPDTTILVFHTDRYVNLYQIEE
jgi:hypothetical protein